VTVGRLDHGLSDTAPSIAGAVDPAEHIRPCRIRSPFMIFTTGREFDAQLDRKAPYELNAGERKATQRLRIAVEPGAITVSMSRKVAA
jgi:hypothetical protein